MEGNENSVNILKDVSNFKTPKRRLPPPSLNSPCPQFFTASKQTPTTSSLRHRHGAPPRSSHSKLKSATARRLKAFELEQSQSARKFESRKEQSLKSLSRSLTTWLNFLLQNPRSCGCNGSVDGESSRDGERYSLGSKRDSGCCLEAVGVEPTWRCPKRQREWSWKCGADVEMKDCEGGDGLLLSSKRYVKLRDSLNDVCSFDDLKQRMRGYLSLASCKEIFDVMIHVVKNIDDGRLKMKLHCPVVTDIGLKEKAIQVLMSYNPIWLRIGLYIVFGGDSLLPDSNVTYDQEISFLKIIIEKQFFAHAGLAKTYAYNKKVEGLYRPEYYQSLGNVILKRFLLLVLVLDRAKPQSSLPLKYGIDGLDGGSPLLFKVQSSIKSSKQVISDFLSSELMHGEGNVFTHLGIIGYKVCYQQLPLIEYDFRVTNLFSDLQDGVRLCRAIQLLLNDSSLLMKIIVPSDTYKKSLKNCGVALKYLKNAGVSTVDEDGVAIAEDDVACGDKELTISLLWNMFVHLQLPLLIHKTILQKEVLKIHMDPSNYSIHSSSSLDLLLKWIQVVCVKYSYMVDNFSSLVDGKAIWCLLDYYFRKELSCAQSDKRLHDASAEESIMSANNYCDAVHNFLLSQKLTTLLGNFPEVLQLSDLLEHNGAISERSVIILLVFLASQLLVKKNMDELNFHKLLGCNCQSQERRYSSLGSSVSSEAVVGEEEMNMQDIEDGARKFKAIKAWWQDMAARNHNFGTNSVTSAPLGKSSCEPSSSIQRENAAKIIQSHFRRSFEQQKFLKMRNAAVFLQIIVRAWLAVKKTPIFVETGTALNQQLVHEGAISSEKAKGYVNFIVDRHRFLDIRRSVQLIQQAARIWKAREHPVMRMRSHDESTPDAVAATIIIQKHFRRCIAKSRYKIYQTEKASSTKVNDNSNFGTHAIRRCQYSDHFAATMIQSNFRCWLLRRKYSNLKSFTIKIQSHVRRQRWQRSFQQLRISTKSAMVIQSHVRGWIAQRRARRERYLIGVLQSYCRKWLIRKRFLLLREAVTRIQSHVRGWIARRQAGRQRYLIGVLQSYCRKWLIRKRFVLLREAAKRIQSHVRGWIAWRRARRQMYLIGVLQRYCRKWLIRKRFLLLREAATKIQSVVLYLNCSNTFQLNRHAAIQIQSYVRGQNARNRLLGASHYHDVSSNNCRLLASRNHDHCVELNMVLFSILKLQRWWRGVLLLRKRTKLALVIQSSIRGWIDREKASKKRRQVVLIQSYWRGYLARKELKGRLLELRLKVKESAKNVDDSKRIINRLIRALSELQNMKSVSEILHICATCDMATEHSQRCCEELVAAGAIERLLRLIRSVSRSIPDQEILKHSLSTLRNVARYPHLIELLIGSHHLVETVLWVFLRNKDEGYFIASELLRRICANWKGVEAMYKSPALLKRLHMLVEELTRKATNEKRNPRGIIAKENTERRLREAVDLLKLITGS